MPKEQSTVQVQCNRRGSVTAGPLTLHQGINEVSEEEFREFRKTKLGAALVKQGVLTDPAKSLEPEPVELGEDDNKDSAEVEGGAANGSGEEPVSEAPVAPSLDLSAAEAIDYVKGLDDQDLLVLCHEQEKRKTVQAACIERAEELEEARGAEETEDKDPEDEE